MVALEAAPYLGKRWQNPGIFEKIIIL